MINLVERAVKHIPSYGLYITMPDPALIETAKAAGYDYARLDAEHINFSAEVLTSMFRTARLLDFPLQIRLGTLENIDQILALEPSAVMAPDIRTFEDAKRLTDAVKFAPKGERGMYAYTEAIRFGGIGRAEYMARANCHIHTIIQIESREGMENLGTMLQLPGIDMVSSGKADLSQAFGIPGQTSDPTIIAAEERIVKIALEHRKTPTLFAESPERLRALYTMGVSCFIVGFDSDLCMRAMKERLDDCRKLLQ